jgi:drug/metabolite transporter superfamily protein YnfA
LKRSFHSYSLGRNRWVFSAVSGAQAAGFGVVARSRAACSLALFAWLLSLHPTAAGRVYAAYGGVDITVALLWLWLVDSVRPTVWDVVGGGVCLLGMTIIILGTHPT